MSEQLSERGKDLVKYMPQAVNTLADRLTEKLTERVLYGEKPQTNYDLLISKTPEELARWICNISDCPYCPGKELDCRVGGNGIMTGALGWLKSPAEEVQDET